MLERVLDELWLVPSLVLRVLRGKLSPTIAWWLLDTWWPFRAARRLRSRARIWRARRYRGEDEFHSSLNMDVEAMLDMTEAEREAYMEDLIRRRDQLHRRFT